MEQVGPSEYAERESAKAIEMIQRAEETEKVHDEAYELVVNINNTPEAKQKIFDNIRLALPNTEIEDLDEAESVRLADHTLKQIEAKYDQKIFPVAIMVNDLKKMVGIQGEYGAIYLSPKDRSYPDGREYEMSSPFGTTGIILIDKLTDIRDKIETVTHEGLHGSFNIISWLEPTRVLYHSMPKLDSENGSDERRKALIQYLDQIAYLNLIVIERELYEVGHGTKILRMAIKKVWKRIFSIILDWS